MTMPYVLYRPGQMNETAEMNAISAAFGDACGTEIEDIPAGSLVFPRYCAIPFGPDLEREVLAAGSHLVNSWEQYSYVAQLSRWVHDLEGMTPGAYTEADLEHLPEGEYFIKGETNSNKNDWFGSAFAASLADVHRIVGNLHQHVLLKDQQLVIRPFVHYRRLATQPSGQPVFNEWRVFVLDGQVMAKGFYWLSQEHLVDMAQTVPLRPERFQQTLERAIEIVSQHTNFVVIDLAERPDGTWDVIELNDANMAGVSCIDPAVLWSNIAAHYKK